MAQSTPWLTALFQGILKPQALCIELDTDPLTGILFGPPGLFTIEGYRHRLAITFQIQDQQPDPAALSEKLRNTSLYITDLLLKAQALYSTHILKLDSYSMTIQIGDSLMTPFWVELEPPSPVAPAHIKNDDFKRASVLIAKPALFHNHGNLQRALRDYELALETKGNSRLIYLWRAVEEILWFYALKSLSPSKQLPQNPPFGKAAKELELYHDPSNKDQWIKEIAKLAHEYARHAEARPGKPKLPDGLDVCIEVARQRVVEMITRLALDLSAKHGQWQPLTDDILKDWV